MLLPWDICRCRGIDDDNTVCDRRNGCARYIAATSNDFGPRSSCVAFICQDGQDAFIRYVNEQLKASRAGSQPGGKAIESMSASHGNKCLHPCMTSHCQQFCTSAKETS